MCEGASNQTTDKNSTAPGPRPPPLLKFLDPPLMGPGSLLRSENLTVTVFSERNKDMILMRFGILAIFSISLSWKPLSMYVKCEVWLWST